MRIRSKALEMQLFEDYDFANIFMNCLLSLQRVFIGVAIALLIGIVVGILRSALPPKIKNNKLIRFLFEAPKFPPPIAWIPFVILLFGIGEKAAYCIVFIGAFSPIFINTFQAAETLPLIWKQSAASMEIRGFNYYYHIVFKGSLPQIFVGLRAGISMGWMSVIAAEMISGQSGLGYSIQMNRLNLQYGLMIVDMCLIGAIGFLLVELIGVLENKIVPWRRGI